MQQGFASLPNGQQTKSRFARRRCFRVIQLLFLQRAPFNCDTWTLLPPSPAVNYPLPQSQLQTIFRDRVALESVIHSDGVVMLI